MSTTAVLVDGSFYLRMANKAWGSKDPEARAEEAHAYALSHIDVEAGVRREGRKRSLYRIFFYDCPPITGINIRQSRNGRNASLTTKSGVGLWRSMFLGSLANKHKVALRLGELNYRHARFIPNLTAMQAPENGSKAYADLVEEDFELVGIKREGVDMRIDLDVASLANAQLVDQIVLVAGDSDFIPVAKTARKAGIDFIVDPMGHPVHKGLVAHVDAIEDLVKTSYTLPSEDTKLPKTYTTH